MSLITRLLIAFALCCFAAAGYSWHWAHALITQYRWTPLQVPVQLKPGLVLTSPLDVDLTGLYDLSLDVQRTLPPQQTDCLLGIELPSREQCAAVKHIGDIRWSLYSGETLVSSGGTTGAEHGGGHWGPTVGRNLGRFKATAGVRYTLRVESAAEAPELNLASPAVVVTVDPYRFKTAYVNAAIAQLVAQVLAGLGAITLLCTWLAIHRQRRRDRAKQSA